MTQVVTELIIDASKAEWGSAQYVKCDAQKLLPLQEKSVATMTRQTDSYAKLQAQADV